jgi:hypothetical protein
MTPNRILLGFTLAGLAAACTTAPPPPAEPTADDYLGKWSVLVTDAEDTFASGQIDITEENGQLAGALVWRWGGYGPARHVEVTDGVLQLDRDAGKTEEGEDRGDDVFEARLEDGVLKGTVHYADGKTQHFEGRRAASLARTAEPVWGEPVTLFDGETLEGWSLRDPSKKMGWAVVDGDLAVVDPEGNADLVSDETFEDMKLHLEFNMAPHSNSGVYLRGRYEIQLESGDPNSGKKTQKCGALYSRIAPSKDATKPAGEWQTLDITLVGRELEVVLNGEPIIDGTVEGITGGALSPFEDEPGPLMLQGDHGKVRFRNIVVTPASS